MPPDSSQEGRTPAEIADTRRVVMWKTAAVVAGMAAVWAVGLGVIDRSIPEQAAQTFQSSPTARVERRPALFAVTWYGSEGASGPGMVGVAMPVVLVEAGGALISPVTEGVDASRAASQARAFVDTYVEEGTGLLLLRGGAAAGDVRFVGGPIASGQVPAIPVSGASPGMLGPDDATSTTLLAISDRRFAGRSSGVRGMRDQHRAAVDEATRQIMRDRFPSREVVDEGLARVRVADLDRDGRPEVLASRDVRVRESNGTAEHIALFVIVEPEQVVPNGSTEYRIAFVAMQAYADEARRASVTFIDQADLTSLVYDEVVVRLDDGDVSRYAVLRRDQAVWTQVSSTPPIRLPNAGASPGQSAGH